MKWGKVAGMGHGKRSIQLEQAWAEAFHLDQIRGVWDDIIHHPRVRVISCSGEQQEEEKLK